MGRPGPLPPRAGEEAGTLALRHIDVQGIAGSPKVPVRIGSYRRAKPVRDLLVREARFDPGCEHASEDEEPGSLDVETRRFGRPTEGTIQHVQQIQGHGMRLTPSA
jgi:hypothetical protein